MAFLVIVATVLIRVTAVLVRVYPGHCRVGPRQFLINRVDIVLIPISCCVRP